MPREKQKKKYNNNHKFLISTSTNLEFCVGSLQYVDISYRDQFIIVHEIKLSIA